MHPNYPSTVVPITVVVRDCQLVAEEYTEMPYKKKQPSKEQVLNYAEKVMGFRCRNLSPSSIDINRRQYTGRDEYLYDIVFRERLKDGLNREADFKWFFEEGRRPADFPYNYRIQVWHVGYDILMGLVVKMDRLIGPLSMNGNQFTPNFTPDCFLPIRVNEDGSALQPFSLLKMLEHRRDDYWLLDKPNPIVAISDEHPLRRYM